MEILELLKRRNRAQSIEDIQRALQVEDLQALLIELSKLEEKGLIRKTKKGDYLPRKGESLFPGRMSIPGSSYGFFVYADGSKEDVFVHRSNFGGAMDGDEVLVNILPTSRGGREEGKVNKITKRKHRLVLGTYYSQGYVIPLSRRLAFSIFVDKKNNGGARGGEIVQVEILHYESHYKGLEGKVVQSLGELFSPGLDLKLVVEEFDLPMEFPEDVIKEAKRFRNPSPEEIANRRRIEDLVFTIDGADAKDFDDAISIVKVAGGFRLGVHIADVSHYVKEGSLLDQEALKRGTSVYLVNHVIPMLPEEISNGLCSLNPKEDKLCFSVVMDIDKEGKVLSADIFPSVLQSSYRLVYDDVTAFLEGKEDQKLEPIRRELETFKELTELLRIKRDQRGAMDFGSSEPFFILDDEGWPIEVLRRHQGLADQMIEEAMILTNTTVSEHFSWMEMPFLYRSHEKPEGERMAELNRLLHSFGYLIKGDVQDIHPKQLSELLKSLKGKPEEDLLVRKILRYLKQARYTDVLIGHFGLALEHYSHFTAPIRRYPDLQIHRIMKEALTEMNRKKREHYQAILADVALQSSIKERKADEAERRMDEIKKAEYMMDKIGQRFQGKVSGVANFGIFVELENTIEGMIRLEDLQDYYELDQDQTKLVARNGKEIHLGQSIELILKSVQVYQGEINFIPEEKL
ncbi:MAG: ribonuclease R [Tissierellia bacterium]|nr:ribonuclease R [Tissierellia bacterium]